MGKKQHRVKGAEKGLSDNGRFRQDGSAISRPKLGCGFPEQGPEFGGNPGVVEPGVVNDEIKDTMRLNPVLLRHILIRQDCPVFVDCLAEFESFIIAIRIESCNPRITVPVVDQKTIVIPQGVRGIPCRVALCNLFVSKRRYYRVKMCVGPRLRYLDVDLHTFII